MRHVTEGSQSYSSFCNTVEVRAEVASTLGTGFYSLSLLGEWHDLTDLQIVKLVNEDGRINACGARIPIRSNWNFRLLDSLCNSDDDREVVTFLRYGWPINRDNSPLPRSWMNHNSANQFQEQVTRYICKELRHNTIMGPFVTSPFPTESTGISPISTRPKKNSEKRRIIMDLSWPPQGPSVNTGIPKDEYLRNPIKLRYPTIDDVCRRVAFLHQTGNGKLIFGWKKDMERAFKQILLCPMSWGALGFMWLNAIFFDKTAVMGCRSAPYVCQRTTNMIRHFMFQMSYVVYNYIDDFMSVNFYREAWASFNAMGNLLRDLGVNESMDKSVQPSQQVEFLGILYDLINMLIKLPEEKLKDMELVLQKWEGYVFMTKKQLQCVVGKLQFAAACVRSGRVFVNRLYDKIALMQDGVRYVITMQVRKDLEWWRSFLRQYNGSSIMWMCEKNMVDEWFATDACLKGAGGFCQGNYYHITFPKKIFDWGDVNIAHLELLAIIIGVRLWKNLVKGMKFVVGCDNEAVVTIINMGRSRNELLQTLLRELMYNLAQLDSQIHAKFIRGEDNRLPDILSRWTLDKKYQLQFQKLKQESWKEWQVQETLMDINTKW